MREIIPENGESSPQPPAASAIDRDWRDFRVTTFNGQHDTNKETGHPYETKTLGEIMGARPAFEIKANAPAFIPSQYHSDDARTHQVQREHGQFVALAGDVDKGNIPMDRVLELGRRLFGTDTALFVYSSSSATETDKRWRIIVPLKKPVRFDIWNEAQTAFFDFMEENGVPMDRSLDRAGQPVFLPNVPIDRRDEDGNPNFYRSYLEGEEGLPL